MSLRLTTKSNVAALIDLATIKLHCRVTHDVEDALLVTYLTAAARTFEAQTGRQFGTATWTLTLDALPAVIQIDRPAVAAVTLKIIDADGVEQTVATEQMTLVRGDFASYLSPAPGAVWPVPAAIPGAVTVTITENMLAATGGEIDGDLKAALLLMIAHLYRRREAVSEESLHEVPMAVATLLTPYRTVFC